MFPLYLFGMAESFDANAGSGAIPSLVGSLRAHGHSIGSTLQPPALRAAWGGLVPWWSRPQRTSGGKSCLEHQYRGDLALRPGLSAHEEV